MPGLFSGQLTDFDGTENNNGMFNDGSGYGINSASDMSNGFVDNLLDPTGFVKGFYNDMMGFTSQEREFEQQERMTDKQNQWNSASAQMARAKAAGINPLTAAGGIAGNGQSSAAPAGGAATPSSAASDAIGNFARLGSDNAAKNAAANLDNANANRVGTLLQPELAEKVVGIASAMMGVGVPELDAAASGAILSKGGIDAMLAGMRNPEMCRRFDVEFEKLEAEAANENKRFEEIQSEIVKNYAFKSEAEKNAALADARKQHEDVIRQIDNARLNVFKNDGFDPYWQLQVIGYKLYKKFGENSPEYQGWLKSSYDFSYWSQRGTYDSDIDTAFDRAYNGGLATHQLALEYGYSEARIDVIKNAIHEYSKFLLSNGGGISGIESAIGKLLNAVLIPTAKGEFNMNDVLGAKRPFIEPRKSLHYHQSSIH